METISIFFLILVIIYFSFSSVLFFISRAKNKKGNVYLSLGFLLKAILHIAPALLIFEIDISYSAYITGPIKVSLLPLFYLYFVKLSTKEKGITKTDFVHFIPLLLDLIFTLIIVPGNAVAVVSSAGKGAVELQKMFIENNYYFNLLAFTGRSIMFVQGIVYSFLIYSLYKKYASIMKQHTSLINNENLIWIKWAALLFCIMGVLTGVEIFGVYSILSVFIIMFIFSIYFPFYLVLHAIMQPDLVFIDAGEETCKETDKLEDDITISSKIEELKKNLTESKIYLQPELTINELAAELKMPKYKLSKIIKYGGYKNFYAFVNEYRIEHSKIILKDLPDYYSLNSVAIDSGFKSRSTFYRVFKEFTGKTPKQYLEDGS